MCIMHEFFPLEFRTGKTQLSHTMCGKLGGSHMHAVCIMKHLCTLGGVHGY